MSLETPLHKAQGLGSSHSGVRHFWTQRITAVALVPLSLWFAIAMLGLVGVQYTDVLQFINNPVNAVLLAAFVLISLYHMVLGLQEVILDYIPHPGLKFASMLAVYGFAFAVAAAGIIPLIRILGS